MLAWVKVKDMSVLGIADPWIWLSYVGCFLCVAFCVAYGLIQGRKGAEEEDEQDGKAV